jgi:hypothetical protein
MVQSGIHTYCDFVVIAREKLRECLSKRKVNASKAEKKCSLKLVVKVRKSSLFKVWYKKKCKESIGRLD